MSGATDLTVKVGADISGFKSGMSVLPGVAKGVGLAIAAAFAAGTAAVLKAAEVGSKFEQTLTETATVAQAFGKNLKALEDKARDLGRTTAFTATEAAKGMYDLASAGMSTKEIVDSVEYAMKLAGATGSEMSQATHVLAASLKQFGMDASESKRITDTFSAAITNTQLTMERLTEGMKYAGTTGASLGWSIEETTAALAQFVNLGLEGSQAGTNLRMAMISLVKQTDDMKDALDEMGLSFRNINPETHTFGEIIKTLGEHSMTSSQAVAIFGARAALNMKQLSKAAVEGKADFEGLLQKLIESQEGVGRTTEMYDRMMDTFQGKWIILKSAISDLFISFFDTFKDSGKDLFESWTDDINDFAQFIRDNGPAITEFFETLAFVIDIAAKSMLGFIQKTGEFLIKLKELKDQTVEGVKNTANAIEESWNYIPKFFNDLVMAWYDLADELQKKELKTFFKEQFLTSGHEMSKFVAVTKTNQEALDKIMNDLNPEFYKMVDTLKDVGNAADDTYTDWQDLSKKTKDKLTDDIEDIDKDLKELKKTLELLGKKVEPGFLNSLFKTLEAQEDVSKLNGLLEKLNKIVEDSKDNKLSPLVKDADIDKIKDLIKEIKRATGEQWNYNKEVELSTEIQRDFSYQLKQQHAQWLENASKMDVFVHELKNAFAAAGEETKEFYEYARDMAKTFVDGFRTMWGESFYNIMTGQFDDIDDAFSNFFDGLLNKFTSLLGDMVANDMLKGGLKNVLGVGLAGGIGYYGAGMLGGNQASQNLAAVGAMVGMQYGGGWGALAGGIIGYFAGNVFGKKDTPQEKPPTYYMPNINYPLIGESENRKDYTFDFYKMSSFTYSGYSELVTEITNMLNDALDSVADGLSTTLNTLPVELRKKIITGYKYINPQMADLGFGSTGASGLSAAQYKQYVSDIIENLGENAQHYLDAIAKSMGQTSWEAFEKYAIKFEAAAQTSSSLIADAFSSAFDTGNYSFDTFKNNLYDAIYETIKNGMIDAFLQSEAFRSALNPFFLQFQQAIENATVGGFLDPALFTTYINRLPFNQMVNNINALQPVIDSLANALSFYDLWIDRWGRAEGGPVSAGRPYIVGENEPELFVPETDGYIYPKVGQGAQTGSQIVFINQGVMTESEFFAKSMRKYQDYRHGDTIQTANISTQGLRLG